MTTAYIVLERSFAYNDEIYYSDSKGGMPINVFLYKEEAEKYCNKLEAEKIQELIIDNRLSDYSYENFWDKDTEFLEFQSRLMAGEKLSDKELKKLIKMVHREISNFYFVAEAEISHPLA